MSRPVYPAPYPRVPEVQACMPHMVFRPVKDADRRGLQKDLARTEMLLSDNQVHMCTEELDILRE